jgi:hypothetical protein
LGLHAFAPGPRPPNPSRRSEVALEEFPTTAGNGVAIETGDVCQPGNPAVALHLGEEAEDQASALLVGNSHQAIEGLVLTGDRSIRVLPAGGTVAGIDDLSVIR